MHTGFRSDYLGALRRLSRDNDRGVYLKALRFLHDYTAQIDWTTHETAEADLRDTNAFEHAECAILTDTRAHSRSVEDRR